MLLMLASAWASVAHRHANEANSSLCQICIAAHSASPTVAALAPKPVFLELLTFTCQVLDAKQHLLAFALSVRPPPIA
jgi:hypothetical protein